MTDKNDPDAPTISLTTYFKFPLKVDGPGLYIFDARNDMVADNATKNSSESVLSIAVDAFNASIGLPTATPPLPAHLAAPFRFVPEETMVFDANDEPVLRIRGWGQLKRLGRQRATAIQDLLGETFASALNARYGRNA